MTADKINKLHVAIEKNKQKVDVIEIIIDSEGGDPRSGFGFAIYLCRLKGVKIKTVAFGSCYSTAAAIFLSGDIRVAYTSADIMIHKIKFEVTAGVLSGRELTASGQDLNSINVKWVKFLSDKMNIKLGDVRKYTKEDWQITAEEGKDYGFIDKIIKA